MNNEEYLEFISELVNTKATAIACEEMKQYEKDHPNALITTEIRSTIIQRCVADLMLHLCGFHRGSADERNDIQNHFDEWFITEEASLRAATYGNINTEVKKNTKPGDENLTFTERFRKSVAESRRTGSSLVLADSWKDK